MGWPLVRRYADLLLAVAVAVLFTLEVARWETTDPVPLLLTCWLGALGLTLRRRSPLVGFVLAFGAIEVITQIEPGFDNDSAALVVTFFVSLFSLGRHTSGLERWLGAVGVVAAMVLFTTEGGSAPDSGDLGFAFFFVGTPWAAGLALRLRTEREQLLAEHNAMLQRDQDARARAAVAAERARIARELHDVVAHAISVTVMQARGGRAVLGRDDDAVRRALDAIEQTNTAALGDMRRLLAVLRDTDHADEGRAAPQPSLANLDRLLDQVRSAGLDVELDVQGEAATTPPGVDLSAYRIVQEALTNVIKHAGPEARAQVKVTYAPHELTVSIRDDGLGRSASSAATGGHGLIGIRERVAVVGGHVEAGPLPGSGFAVTARLPYTLEDLESQAAAAPLKGQPT